MGFKASFNIKYLVRAYTPAYKSSLDIRLKTLLNIGCGLVKPFQVVFGPPSIPAQYCMLMEHRHNAIVLFRCCCHINY